MTQPTEKPDQSSQQPIDKQWQTKDSYKQSNAKDPVDATVPAKNAKLMRITTIVLAVSLIVVLLHMTTPLGNLFSIQPGPDISRPIGAAYPILAVATAAAIFSFFLLMSLRISNAKTKGQRTTYIGLLVVGAVAVGNPIGAIIIFMTIMCNLSPCSGS